MLVFLVFSLIVISVTHSLVLPFSAGSPTSVHSFCIQSCPLSEHAELYRAIVCGSSLPHSSIRSNFVQTGLIHLLVVSGQHYCFLESLVESVTRRWPAFAKWSVGLLVLGTFTLASGASPPAVRAAAAWSARRVSDQFKLSWSRPQTVACSVALTLAFCNDMTDLLSLALSGTAAATLAFPWVVRTPAKRMRRTFTKLLARLREGFLLQARLYLMLIPALCAIAIPHPLSILWNMLAGPLIGQLLFPMSLVGFFVPILVKWVDLAWHYALGFVAALSSITPRSPSPIAMPTFFGIGYALLLIGSTIALERRRRSSLLAFTLLVTGAAAAQSEPRELVVWNVGQGSWATVIEGDRCTHFDMGGEFAPWGKIRASCEGRKNSVLFSHWDWDHVSFTPKAARTLDNMCLAARPGGTATRIREKIISSIAECAVALPIVENTPVQTARAASSNASSRVFTFGGAIFPGDATKTEESRFRKLRAARILILPHHGSRTSTSDSLLTKTKPRMAIASSRKEKYGHPHPTVIARLKERGVSLLRTEEWGSIRIQMKKPERFELRPFVKRRDEKIRGCTVDTPC
ncbi:MAG: ComEC/Rec2 family competence protein [Bdellovibrionota bacterium]